MKKRRKDSSMTWQMELLTHKSVIDWAPHMSQELVKFNRDYDEVKKILLDPGWFPDCPQWRQCRVITSSTLFHLGGGAKLNFKKKNCHRWPAGSPGNWWVLGETWDGQNCPLQQISVLFNQIWIHEWWMVDVNFDINMTS